MLVISVCGVCALWTFSVMPVWAATSLRGHLVCVSVNALSWCNTCIGHCIEVTCSLTGISVLEHAVKHVAGWNASPIPGLMILDSHIVSQSIDGMFIDWIVKLGIDKGWGKKVYPLYIVSTCLYLSALWLLHWLPLHVKKGPLSLYIIVKYVLHASVQFTEMYEKFGLL